MCIFFLNLPGIFFCCYWTFTKNGIIAPKKRKNSTIYSFSKKPYGIIFIIPQQITFYMNIAHTFLTLSIWGLNCRYDPSPSKVWWGSRRSDMTHNTLHLSGLRTHPLLIPNKPRTYATFEKLEVTLSPAQYTRTSQCHILASPPPTHLT